MTIRNLPRADISSRSGLRSGLSQKVLDRWSPDVRAALEDEDATISMLDVIGQDFWGEGVTAKQVTTQLRRIGQRDVTVVINSPGGDYFEGLAIYNALREHPARVTVKVLGIAASAASVIAMAGDEMKIARAGFLMIHNTWVLAAGDRHAFRDVANWLEPFDAAAVDIYAARTGIAAAEIGQMLDRETWIGGAQAVEDGWADTLLSSDELASVSQSAEGKALRAERKLDLLAAQSGMHRKEARQLRADLKGGTPGAASTGMHDAAVIQGVENLLNRLKSI
ncbi:Clp protease ClpP [Salipiger sp. H15]|uniref:ATP-dependent Clp protease proteolytic subunit n=1 Tax=Alloyangia sp. H15 TaxID=3029062 RepID=A0AAU8AM70_9RHOB